MCLARGILKENFTRYVLLLNKEFDMGAFLCIADIFVELNRYVSLGVTYIKCDSNNYWAFLPLTCTKGECKCQYQISLTT